MMPGWVAMTHGLTGKAPPPVLQVLQACCAILGARYWGPRRTCGLEALQWIMGP